MDISNAVVYDIETFPNCFTLNMEFLNKDFNVTWQISEFKNDLNELREWFNWLGANQIPMIGFNNLHFDYPVIHDIFLGKIKTYQEIYQKAMSIIKSEDKRKHNIWASERFTPQIDLFKIHHFDNKARTTSLKALEINMRSESVMDMPLEVGTVLTKQQIEDVLIPYNKHDVKQTKKFTFFSMNAIDFRISLIKDHGNDVLNWADTKIGSKILEKRLGDNVCYDFSTGRKVKRQTVRTKIRLDEIIFPYVKFDKPEFQKISDNMRTKILKPDEFKDLGKDDIPTIVTEGVFKGMKANVGGLDFIYGLGGIHASIKHKKIISNEEWLIRDIDVASLYPSISKVNRLYPDHLGEIFVEEYGKLPEERKLWQKQKGKKCSEANSLKLASNGTYGNTNSVFSVFYDPKMTMTITINGQLLLSMLTEKLIDIPTLKIIQVNTDGITYYIHKNHEPEAKKICDDWQKLSNLVLEDVDYSRMWIRDVNNYIAETKTGELKLKGAYWTPDPLNYDGSISDAQPPAWHKNISNVVSVRAAIAYMKDNVPIETYLKFCTNPYDFMIRVKVGKSSKLFHGEKEVQRTSRYYVSKQGAKLVKVSPPTGKIGTFKRKSGVKEGEYLKVMNQVGWVWDERVCTKNKGKYEISKTSFQKGFNVSLCNNISEFNFNNINYEWYANKAKKLIIH